MAAPRGAMAVWNDVEPGHEAEFDTWYMHQHIPERLGVPGFLEARRYEAIDGSPRATARSSGSIRRKCSPPIAISNGSRIQPAGRAA
jgi:hypothetical protein